MAFIGTLESSITSVVAVYVTTTSASLAASLLPIAAAGMSLYFIFMGWAIARGEIQEPLSHLVGKCTRTALICAIALVGGQYQFYVIGFINALEGLFTGALGLTTGPGCVATSVGSLIDCSVIPLKALGSRLFADSNLTAWPNFYLLFCAGLISLAQFVVVVFSLIPLLVAKVTLGLLLAIGPPFILLALWPATVRFTEAWLSSALSAVMTTVIIAAVVGFMPAYLNRYSNDVIAHYGATNFLQDVLGLLIVAVVLAWLAWKAAEFGAQVVGGATLGNPAGGLISSYITRWMLRQPPPKPAKGGGGSMSGGGGGTHPMTRRMAQANVMTEIARTQRVE